jgi:hypothetical protein
VADVSDKRESHRDKNALLDADYRHGRRGEKPKEEFARAFAPDVGEALHVDHSDRDREHDARQHAVRQVLQRAGQEHKHDEHDSGERELRDLAARARLIGHRTETPPISPQAVHQMVKRVLAERVTETLEQARSLELTLFRASEYHARMSVRAQAPRPSGEGEAGRPIAVSRHGRWRAFRDSVGSKEPKWAEGFLEAPGGGL